MSKVIFKMRFSHPNLKDTKKNNMYHLLYIGTREGVALNEDLKEVDKNNSTNEEYMKYISDRPRSHGLFSNKECNLKELAEEMKTYNGYVYRGIVSLRENDAIKLGYDSKEKWEMLIKDKMQHISKELNIPYSQLKWVAAFHRESGHPHVHLMIWNKENEVRQSGAIPKKNLASIRKVFTDEIFKEEKEKLLIEKNALREIILEGAKGSETGDFAKFNNLVEKFKDIDSELMSEVEEINSYEIGNKVRNNLIKDIGNRIEKLNVPTTGRLQYKLMPPEVKKEIDKITDEILSNSAYKPYYERYLDSVGNIAKLYTDKEEDIDKSKDKARDDIYNRIGNSILKTKKDIIYKQFVKKTNTDYEVQTLLTSVFKVLSIKTHQHTVTENTFSKTKAQRKAVAKKLHNTGLYSERHISDEEKEKEMEER